MKRGMTDQATKWTMHMQLVATIFLLPRGIAISYVWSSTPPRDQSMAWPHVCPRLMSMPHFPSWSWAPVVLPQYRGWEYQC
jgi:hypothetical protein